MLISLILNTIVLVSAFLITFKGFKPFGHLDSLISLIIFYFSQIIFSELALGIFGALSLKNLLLLNIIIMLVALLAIKGDAKQAPFGKIRRQAAVLLENKISFLIFSIILAFALVKLVINLINPPFGWDSLNYHFTFPVEWMKNGNLDTPITVFDDPSPSYYPINASLYYLWLIFPLSNVFLADLGQFPFFILSFLAVFGISRKLGLKPEHSFFAAGLFTLIPNYFKQLQVAYVDVMVAGLFLACLNYLFLLGKEFCSKNVLVFSLSLGLLLGTKTVALPYSILLFIPFFYFGLKNLRKFYLFLFSISVVTMLGGFAYLRNLFETGNPLYPLDFNLFGNNIFRGAMDLKTYRAHFRIEDYSLSKALFHEGLGAQALIFIFPSVLLALPVSVIKFKKKLDFTRVYFLILPLLLFAVYRYVIPLPNLRYLYGLLAIGTVLGFYLAGLLKIPSVIINGLVIICAFSSAGQLGKSWELGVSFILMFLIFFLSRTFIKLRLLKIIIFLSIPALIFAQNWYRKNEFKRYTKMIKYSGFWKDATQAWEWLDERTLGDNIAYCGRPVPFPLYGSSLKNNVFYVSVNRVDPAKLHFFPKGHYQWGYDFLSMHKNLEAAGNYRSEAEYASWKNNLLKRNTDYLFVYSLHQTKDVIFPIEDSWATKEPGIFKSVFMNKTIHIYKIIR